MRQLFLLFFSPYRFLRSCASDRIPRNAWLIILLMNLAMGINIVFWTWQLAIQNFWRKYIPILIAAMFLPIMEMSLRFLIFYLILRMFAVTFKREQIVLTILMLSIGLIGFIGPNVFWTGPGLFCASLIQMKLLYQLGHLNLGLSRRKSFGIALISSILFIILGMVLLLPLLPTLNDMISGLFMKNPEPIRLQMTVPKQQ